MKQVIILRGLPASSKSTYAKSLIDSQVNKYKRINKDLLREMLDSSHWSNSNEKFVLKIRDTIILEALENGKHVIVDDTNLAATHIARITQLVKGKADVIIKDFTDVPLETCIERDLKRTNSVGEKVIKDMYYKYIHKPIEPIAYNSDLPECIIVDCDGTMNRVTNRSPFDGTNCHLDEANRHVIDIVNSNSESGRGIFVFSGLEDKYQPQRESWLKSHNIKYYTLRMRKSGDYRKDWIIKNEFYEELIKNKYNVTLVIDDRVQMLKFYNSIGLGDKLICVGFNEIEF